MNRKLHSPIIACTALALALSAGLLFASPAAAPARTAVAATVVSADAGEAPVRIERVSTEATGAAGAPRPRARRARSGFALPYFSFARGASGRS